MTSISEAIFKGQIRNGSPSDSPKSIQTVMTEQLWARRAVDAILAGGYACREEAPQPAVNGHPEHHAKGILRYILIWLGVFALAGAITIGTSRLPGHAVQAKPANRGAIEKTAIAVEETGKKSGDLRLETVGADSVAPEEKPSTPPTVSISPTPSISSTPSTASIPPKAVTVAVLIPIKKQISSSSLQPPASSLQPPASSLQPPASSLSATSLPSTAVGTPDDHPLGKSALAVEEVLYEGQPAAKPASGAQPAAIARITRKSAASTRGAAANPAPQRNGSMKVEGIFWDKVRPMAIVNGDIVEIGSQVGEFKVANIKPGLVTLAHGDDRLELRP